MYLEGQNVARKFALGKHTAVLQPEVYAILSVADTDVAGRTEQNIYFCSDSQTALKVLCLTRTKNHSHV